MRIKNLSIFLLIAGLLLGCNSKPPAALTETTDSREAFTKALEKLKEVKSYHALTVKNLEASRSETFIERPDKLLFKAANKSQLMAIGNERYIKDGNGPWKTTKTSPEDDFWVLDYSKFIGSAVCDGHAFSSKTNLDGKSVFTYTAKCTHPTLPKFILKLWLSEETGMPLKVEHLIPQEDLPLNGDPLITTTLFDYEKKADIKAPVSE